MPSLMQACKQLRIGRIKLFDYLDKLGIEHYDSVWGEKPDGQQEIGPSDYIYPLIKAIQEQQALIESLTARIATLEG